MDAPSSGARDDARLAALGDAARRLHGESDLTKVVQWSLEAARDVTGVDEIGLCLLPHDATPTWWTHPKASVSFGLLADPRTVPLVASVLDGTGGVVYEDLAVAEETLEVDSRIRRIVPLHGLAVIPVVGRDVLRGVLLAGWRDGQDLAPDGDRWLSVLATHLGVALENHATLIRLAEEEVRGKEVVHRLQQAVRPAAPALPFTELGVHYVAADPSAPTGGDLYDWIALPNGELHLTVVDVMGKGVQATKDALLVTHALRLLAIDGCDLGRMVERADELVIAQNPDLVATLVVGRYDPQTGRLRLAGAGHPPALVIRGGVVEELPAPGIPIGWPGAASHDVVSTVLERSDTLVLYTDGLIEARKDIVRGLEELAAAAAATASYPATSLARVLIDRQLADAARHDDSLALVLRRRTLQAAPPAQHLLLAPFQHRFSPTRAAVPLARHLLRDWLLRVPVEADAVDGLLLIASELTANAVTHASGGPASVVLDAWVENGGIVLEVSDDGGKGFPRVDLVDLPDPDAERGRGIFLVRELADEVVADVRDGRTVVRAVKRAVVTGPGQTP
ncbi:MAG TPA: SpoIIE family protein phosphatase [Acidimicrobiales bacterium]|jgi:anti-sigma regulatory factor (Ser/Thr protein kinase)|nr:SpoIIE family protein phosphatase [Acidimicrobiales bacterium]